MAEELMGTEIGLAFIIIGILLFLVEATMPGFLVAVPGTVLIALGILMSFDIVTVSGYYLSVWWLVWVHCMGL